MYTRAEKTLEEWIRAHVIVQDKEPSLYAYFQEYTVPGTTSAARAKDLSRSGGLKIIPRAWCSAMSRLFRARRRTAWSCCATRRLTLASSSCSITTRPRASMHSWMKPPPGKIRKWNFATSMTWCTGFWPITDVRTLEAIRSEMADKKLVIADGHHRYETAMAYRDERRAKAGRINIDAPYEKVMMSVLQYCRKGTNDTSHAPHRCQRARLFLCGNPRRARGCV